ncbi:MAG: TetR/AcrR family transcriptional regulator [Acidimicrobiia bacterium]
MVEPVQGRGASKPPPPRPESLDVRQRARRDRIVQATVRLMVHTDYESLQMKDITIEAGVALGTTYRYFNSKEHLVAEALLAWARQFGREVAAPEGRTVDRVKIAYRRAARAFELNPSVYGHMLAVQGSSDPRAVEIFDLFASGRLDAFATYLARVPSPRRERIIAVMSAVLGENLRSWSLGRQSIESVYASLDSAADLLLG